MLLEDWFPSWSTIKSFLLSFMIRNKVDFLTEGEKEYIKRHIPYTALLDVNEEDTIKRLIEEKDHWILKPLDLYAGKGVYAGRDFTPPVSGKE